MGKESLKNEEIIKLNEARKKDLRNKRIAVVAFVLIAIFFTAVGLRVKTEIDYKNAVKLYNSESYESALNEFKNLGKYKDSQEYALKTEDGIKEAERRELEQKEKERRIKEEEDLRMSLEIEIQNLINSGERYNAYLLAKENNLLDDYYFGDESLMCGNWNFYEGDISTMTYSKKKDGIVDCSNIEIKEYGGTLDGRIEISPSNFGTSTFKYQSSLNTYGYTSFVSEDFGVYLIDENTIEFRKIKNDGSTTAAKYVRAR